MPETAVVPCFKVKVTVVIVKGSIASLKVAVTALLMVTPVAALAGTVELTVGAVVSGVAPVVKVHTLLTASALPAKSLDPVVIVAVYVVLAARLLAGVKTAVTPVRVTTPETAVAPCFKVNVVVVIVKGSIASLKVAVIFVLVKTPVAALAGTVRVTVGAVVSRAALVVKIHE